MSTPVQEGMEEDTSPPRSEQEALEEEEQALEPGLGDAVRLDEEIQESSKVSQESTPSPQPKPSEENVKKPGRSSQSLPDPHVQPHALGPGDRRRFSDIPNLKPTTPAHHDIPKGKPPPSPKGHPTKDLPISPDRPRRQSGERSDDVQRWRSEVQRHSSHTEDVLEETSEEIITTPPSPTHSPIKRKRLSEDISRRTTMIEHKRRRRSFIHEELREIPSTPERETSQRPLSPTLSNPGATVGSSMSAMQDFMKEEDEDENYDAVEDQQYKEESPVLSLHSDSSIVAINHIEEEGEVNLYDEELSPSNRAYRAREKGKRRQSDMGNGTETTLKREDTPEQSYYEEVHKRDEYTEVQEYVYAKAREYNVPETDVVEAIERTSGIRKLVEVVLQEFSQGRGLPEDMRGVWTLEDDQWLLDGDRRQRQAMEMKHGNVRERIEWLRMYNA